MDSSVKSKSSEKSIGCSDSKREDSSFGMLRSSSKSSKREDSSIGTLRSSSKSSKSEQGTKRSGLSSRSGKVSSISQISSAATYTYAKPGKKLMYVSPSLGPDRFSAHHPMIPKRYVPPWQLDMKNRTRILEIAQAQEIKTWGGHVSYFLDGRERLNASCFKRYDNLDGSRRLSEISSPFSRYNSSMLHLKSSY